MRFNHYILLFLLLSAIACVYYLFFHKNEGFESLTNCLSQGYPVDFCKRSPLQACVTNCPIGTFMPKTFNTF